VLTKIQETSNNIEDCQIIKNNTEIA
jgi:hypothetical protein